MQRTIDVIACKKPPSLHQPAGKPRFLRAKDLQAAFSLPDVVLGRTSRGVHVFLARTATKHDAVSIILLAAQDDLQIIKDTFESIFLSETVGQVELAPGEIDLRQNADSTFSGRWYVWEEEGFSFMFLADSGFEIRLNEKEAIETFTSILKSLGGR
jgi:hypothetical protein